MSDLPVTPNRFLVAVTAYERPEALGRLLRSLEALCSVDSKFDLLISIDGDGDPECEQRARRLEWPHGGKEVLVHGRNLGLKLHLEATTDRVRDYDAIVILEDDLSVSPWMLHYCAEAFRQYGSNPEVAQISLYCHQINEAGLPFAPINDGYDVWFSRVPSSWGQMVSREQWMNYRDWANRRQDDDLPAAMPPAVLEWRHTWKRFFFEYISIHRLWVVYPFRSLSTNHGNPGMNHVDEFLDLQAPLELVKRDYRWCSPGDTLARYDEWLEPMPDTFALGLAEGSRLQVDLKGGKPLGRPDDGWMLSTKPCSSPMARFSAELVPLEMNVRFGVPAGDDGPCIALGQMGDFADGSPAQEVASRQIPRALRRFLSQEFWTARRRRLLRYKIAAFFRRLFGFEDAA